MHKMSRRRRLDSRSCKVHSGKEPGNTLHAIRVPSLPSDSPKGRPAGDHGARLDVFEDWQPEFLTCRWQREIAHMLVYMAAHPFRIAAAQRVNVVAPGLLARPMQSALLGA